MSLASRKLSVGDDVLTDFSQNITYHKIAAIKKEHNCLSKILFQVSPAIPTASGPDVWFDADWFEPIVAP